MGILVVVVLKRRSAHQCLLTVVLVLVVLLLVVVVAVLLIAGYIASTAPTSPQLGALAADGIAANVRRRGHGHKEGDAGGGGVRHGAHPRR